MPRCYMVKKNRQDGPPPRSPTEASVAPPCYSPTEYPLSVDAESQTTENDQIPFTPLLERTAADTQAAHDLLSLANSRPPPLPPPLPPQPPAVEPAPAPEPEPAPSLEPYVPLLQAEAPLVPVYTYTISPTSIFIVTEDPPEAIYPAGPNITPVPQFEYTIDPQVYFVDPHFAYQPIPEPQIQFTEPLTIPIIVETVPMELAPQPPPPPPPAPMLQAVMPAPQPPPTMLQSVAPPPQTVPVLQSVPPPAQLTQAPESVISPSQSAPMSQSESPPSPPPVYSSNTAIEPGEIRPPATSKDKSTKYDCNECGKRYATSSNLSRHKQTHRSLDSVAAKKCGYCGKAYVSMPALAMHVLTHKMGYMCHVCGKHFSRPWLLRGHTRSHTGERPYGCPITGCRKAFGDRSNLRAHLQTHSGEKNYQCCRCQKTFALKTYLIKHQEYACYRPC